MRVQLPEDIVSYSTDDGKTHVLAIEPISDKLIEIHVGNDWAGELQINVDKPKCAIYVNDREV